MRGAQKASLQITQQIHNSGDHSHTSKKQTDTNIIPINTIKAQVGLPVSERASLGAIWGWRRKGAVIYKQFTWNKQETLNR